MLYQVQSSIISPSAGFELITLVVIDTRCCKSNYHMITTNDADRNEFSSGLNQNRQNTFVAVFRLKVYSMF